MISPLALLLSLLAACTGGSDKPADTGTPCEAPQTWYTDADGDGFGDPGSAVEACVPPDGAIAEAGDCDDGAADVFPGAPEIWYDGADEDCSGGSDFDQDGDGYDVSEECDDLDPERYPDPAAGEVWYDGVDQDCDGNDGDQDGDGWYAADYPHEVPAAYAGRTGDCWDDPAVAHPPLNDLPAPTAAEVHPDAPEAWYDGVDGDCAGGDDFDADVDGWRTSAYADEAGTFGLDCADDDAAVYPGAPDEWYDGVDADCGGDDDFDADRDGYAPDAGGCDDTNAGVHPDAVETCATAADDNCDGSADEPDALGCTTFYADADGDRYGDLSACLCAASGTYTAAVGGDCNDGDGGVHPDAAEVCDGVDQDCDGAADDGLPLYYPDADGDSWGSGAGSCGGAGITRGEDCDDADRQVYPGAPELCDGRLNDCSRAWTPTDEDGTATVYVADGTVEDISAALASGTARSPYAYTAREGARLVLCPAHWYVRVAMASSMASAEIVGLQGSAATILDAAGTGRVIDAASAYGLTLTVEGVTLLQGWAASGAGLAVATGTVTLDDVVFDGNLATGSGGGLYVGGGSATVTSSSFVGNIASVSGGAVEASSTSLRLADVTFEDNYAGPSTNTIGGAVRYFGESGSSLEITGCSFSGNYATASSGTAQGGAVYVYGGDTGSVTIDATTFDTNEASGTSSASGRAEGGAVYVYHSSSGATVLGDLGFVGNDARGYLQGSGGAMYLWAAAAGTVTLSGATFDSNATYSGTDTGYGGAVYLVSGSAGTIDVVDSTFTGNATWGFGTALSGSGGALAASTTGGRLGVSGTTMTDNAGSYAGGVHLSLSGGTSASLSGGTTVSGSTGYGVEVDHLDAASTFALADSLISGGSSAGLYLYASGVGVVANASCQGSPAVSAGIYGNASYGVYLSTGGGATATFVNTDCDYADPSTGTGNGRADIQWGSASYDYGVDASPTCAVGACVGS